MYNRWKSLPELRDILVTIDFDDDQEMSTSCIVDLSGDATSDEEGMVGDDNTQASGEKTSDK
jgi:hypothetical protein